MVFAVYAALRPHADGARREARLVGRSRPAGPRGLALRARYRVGTPLGVACLAAATGLVAGDSVDGEAGDRRAAAPRARDAPLGRYVAAHRPVRRRQRRRPARLPLRDRRRLAARGRPTCCATLRRGPDLSAGGLRPRSPPATSWRAPPATSRPSARWSASATISGVSTALAFVGALGAMLAVDPWLTLWAMAPVPVLVLLARRYNTAVHRAHARGAGAAGRPVDARAGATGRHGGRARLHDGGDARAAEFAAANARAAATPAWRWPRSQAHFTPLMGLIGGVGTLVVLWVGRQRGRRRPAVAGRAGRLHRLPRVSGVADDGARLDAVDLRRGPHLDGAHPGGARPGAAGARSRAATARRRRSPRRSASTGSPSPTAVGRRCCAT